MEVQEKKYKAYFFLNPYFSCSISKWKNNNELQIGHALDSSTIPFLPWFIYIGGNSEIRIATYVREQLQLNDETL